MESISQNWVWVLFAVGMIAMHLFGHGGYGGHGGNDDRQKMTPAQQEKTVNKALRSRTRVIIIDSSESFSRSDDVMLDIKIVTWPLEILTTFTFFFAQLLPCLGLPYYTCAGF